MRSHIAPSTITMSYVCRGSPVARTLPAEGSLLADTARMRSHVVRRPLRSSRLLRYVAFDWYDPTQGHISFLCCRPRLCACTTRKRAPPATSLCTGLANLATARPSQAPHRCTTRQHKLLQRKLPLASWQWTDSGGKCTGTHSRRADICSPTKQCLLGHLLLRAETFHSHVRMYNYTHETHSH